MEPEIKFCIPQHYILTLEDCKKSTTDQKMPEDLHYISKLYTAIRGRWQYKEVTCQSGDQLNLELDPEWYEASVAVYKNDLLVGHIAREIARLVANFLTFNGRIFPVIYDEIGGVTNKPVWSLRAGGLEIGTVLYFDCNTATEAKDLERHFLKNHCHYVPQVTKQNCPEELKYLFYEH